MILKVFGCKVFGTLFFLYIFSAFVLAEVQVHSSVSPNPVSLQGVLTLTVEIEYSSEKNIGVPRLPGLDTFHVIGQHQSQEFQMINGVTTRKKKYHYQLQPMKEGKFNMGSTEIVVDGKVYKTAPVSVEVSAKVQPHSAPASPFGNRKRLRRFFPSFFDDEEGENIFPFFRNRNIDEEDIFLKLKTEKSKVYVGEMILAEWFFYLPYDQAMNVKSELVKSPNMDGFWVESIVQMGETASKPPQAENIKGKKYKKQLLVSSALFPVRVGELNIGSMEVKSIVFPFMASRVFSKKSKPKKITVLPLPREGKSDFFTEAVGDFHVSASINKKIISVQEPIVYKVSFKGQGQVRGIRLPHLNFGNVWDIYDTTESQKFSVSESVKDFEVILIPKSPGELTIPSFEVSSFDPQLGIYKTHIFPAFKIQVVGVPIPGARREESALYFQTEEAAHKSKEAKEVHNKEGKHTLTPWVRDKKSEFIIKYRKVFWSIVYSLLFLSIVFVLIRRCSVGKEKNRLKVILGTGLRKVDQAVKNEDWKQSGIEMSQLMYSFFSELSGKHIVVKNWDILLKDMHPSIRIKYESKIRPLVSQLDRLSFASFDVAKGIRNKKSVEQLKTHLMDLLKTVSSEYSLRKNETV